MNPVLTQVFRFHLHEGAARGVGRKRGIGAGIGRRLVSLGWDLALTHRSAYDKRMPWGRGGDETGEVVEELERRRKRFISEADLETTSAAEQIFRVAKNNLVPSRSWS